MNCPITIIRTINTARSTKIQQMATATMVTTELVPAFRARQLTIGEWSARHWKRRKSTNTTYVKHQPLPYYVQGDEILISPTPVTNCSKVTIQCCPPPVQRRRKQTIWMYMSSYLFRGAWVGGPSRYSRQANSRNFKAEVKISFPTLIRKVSHCLWNAVIPLTSLAYWIKLALPRA